MLSVHHIEDLRRAISNLVDAKIKGDGELAEELALDNAIYEFIDNTIQEAVEQARHYMPDGGRQL